jgi:hypothetical protein
MMPTDCGGLNIERVRRFGAVARHPAGKIFLE